MKGSTDDLSKLLSSAVLVFAGSVIASVSKLFERVIVGRLLTSAEYGEYSLVLAIFGISATLGAAGFTQGIPRFMARFDDVEDVRGAWLTGLLLSFVVTSVLSVVLLLVSPVIFSRLFESDEAKVLYYALVGVLPIYVCFKMGIAGVRGKENTVYKLATQNLFYPLARLAIIAVLLAGGFGLVGPAFAYVVVIVAVTGATYVLLNRLLPLRGDFRLHGREMTVFSVPLILSTVINVLLTRTDTLMLGYFRSSMEVGLYNAAFPIAGVMIVVLGAFGYMYLPVASRLDDSDDESVERIYQVITKWVYLIVFPMFVTLLVFPDVIVSTAFGAEYAPAGSALAILAVGFFTNAAVGRNRETLSALGATSYILASNLAAFFLNVVLNLFLIPRYGFVGAAVASASSYVVLNVTVCAFLLREFGIAPFDRKSVKSFLAPPLVLIPVGALLGRTLPGSLPVVLLFAIAIGCLTIGVVVAVGGLEADDVVLVDFLEDRTGIHVPLFRRYIPD